MKKQLLNESEVRKFMKFANIGTLTDSFVDRLNEAEETTPIVEQEEEELALDPAAGPGDEPPAEPGEMDAEMDDEMDDEEVVADVEDDDAADQAVQGVKMAVEGLQMAMRAAGRDDLADMISVEEAAAAEAGMPDEEGLEGPVGLTPEEPEGLEENLVNEVARRVARRIANL